MSGLPSRGTGMAVAGLTPLSSVDWPHLLAAVVFCQGCAWSCPYCQNADLRPLGPGTRDWDGIVDWLGTRQGLLEAVVFSGGEPLLQPGLARAMADVRGLGFRVGLHTSGLAPAALETVLPLTHWAGLDVKAPRAAYPRVTGRDGSADAAWQSLLLLRASGTDFELRTTWHPAVLSPAELLDLARELAPLERGTWVIQAFQPKGCADEGLAAAGRAAVPDDLLARLRRTLPGFTVSVRE